MWSPVVAMSGQGQSWQQLSDSVEQLAVPVTRRCRIAYGPYVQVSIPKFDPDRSLGRKYERYEKKDDEKPPILPIQPDME